MILPRYLLSIRGACPVWGAYAGSSPRSALGVGTGTSPGTGGTGAAASCSKRGAAVMVCGLSEADLLLPAPVPSSPVRDALFFGGRDLQISTALQARGGTRGALAWGVSLVGNGIGANLSIQAFFHIGGSHSAVPSSERSMARVAVPGFAAVLPRVLLWDLWDPEGAQGSWWGWLSPGHKLQVSGLSKAADSRLDLRPPNLCRRCRQWEVADAGQQQSGQTGPAAGTRLPIFWA